VSLVINNRSGKYHQISEETRRRVWAAVEELGYVANPAARSLASGRNGLLGVYTFESVFPVDHRDFYYPFLLGIEEEAEQHGYDLVLFTSASGPNRERSIYRNGASRLRVADGCVLLGRGGDPGELRRLAGDPFPKVFIGRREVEGGPVAFVGADYNAATADVVRHLLELEHRTIAYLGWDDDLEPTRDRRAGWERASADAALPVDGELTLRVDVADVDGDLGSRLLDRGVTAFIAQDERLAAALTEVLGAHGRRVPEDVSVAMLGDPVSGPTDVDWTSFVIPRKEMGARALAMLIELLDTGDDGAQHLLLGCTFHRGTTTGPAA
jgi:DNA-binding LacI/PurR family transcriptional regulator